MSKVHFERRGFNPVRKKIEKNMKYNRSCTNCNFYYKTRHDAEEVCQNSNVLEFDVCVDGDRVYCSFWKLVGSEDK